MFELAVNPSGPPRDPFGKPSPHQFSVDLLRKINVLSRHELSQPDAIATEEEEVPALMHFACSNGENDGTAVPGTHFRCRLRVR